LVAAQQPLLPVRGERSSLFWVGQFQVAGFLICSIIGLAIVPAGRAIVLAYTMPLWAIPIGLFLWPEPLRRGPLIGTAIGFAGLVLFMNPGLVDWGNGRVLAGNILLLLAAILWALGSCLYRRQSWRSPFWVQTFWQLAVSIAPGVGDCADRAGRRTGVLVAWTDCDPCLQLHCHDRARLLSVGQGLVDDAGGDGGQVLTLTPIGGFLLSALIFGGTVSADIVLSVMLIVGGIFVTLRR
jgi:drug/metabolite transporter (DMT)-like permease